MSDVSKSELEVVLAEYGSLRQEIDTRATRLHQVLTTQLFVAGAVFTVALGTRPEPGNTAVLLVLPFTSFLLLGRFADQQHAVNRISRFLREHLSPRVPGGLQWEKWAHENPRPQLVRFWLGPMVLAFPLTSSLALTFSFVAAESTYRGLPRWALLSVWILGVVLTLLQFQLVLAAIRDFRGAWWPWADPRKETSGHAESADGAAETAERQDIPAEPTANGGS
jgi:hypothetical protein